MIAKESKDSEETFEFDPKVIKFIQRYSGIIVVIIMIIILVAIIYYMTKYDRFEQRVIANPCQACEQYYQKVCIGTNQENSLLYFDDLGRVNDSNIGEKNE